MYVSGIRCHSLQTRVSPNFILTEKEKKSKSLLLYGKLYNDFTITCCCKRMESPTVKFTQERVGGHRPRGSDNWVAVPDFHIGLLIEDNCTSRFVRSGPYLYLLIQCEFLQHHHDFQGVSVWMRKHVIPLLMARVEKTVGTVSSTLGLGGVASCLDSWPLAFSGSSLRSGRTRLRDMASTHDCWCFGCFGDNDVRYFSWHLQG